MTSRAAGGSQGLAAPAPAALPLWFGSVVLAPLSAGEFGEMPLSADAAGGAGAVSPVCSNPGLAGAGRSSQSGLSILVCLAYRRLVTPYSTSLVSVSTSTPSKRRMLLKLFTPVT